MPAAILLGDWGTTRLRLYLCRIDREGNAEVRASAEGPGVKDVADFEAGFLETAGKLPERTFDRNILLAGMAGSNIGWRETGYVACPASWDAFLRSGASFPAGEYQVTILPGASCVNDAGYHDVMRGEETQLLGLTRSHPAGRERRLVCLPGTHTKWAIIDSEGLQRFATTVQGELFDILRRHSILVPREARGNEHASRLDQAVFAGAVDLLRDNPNLGLIQALFSTRSRQISGEISAGAAASHLSGLLIGADVRDACSHTLRAADIRPPVLLVGDERVASLYAAAMGRYGIETRQFKGDECTVRGLAAAFRSGQQGCAVAT